MMKHLAYAIVACIALSAQANGSVLFDFENAPLLAPLPIELTVGGITAQFSSTGGEGFSIQRADVLFPAPAGFSGKCIYPSGIDKSDLHVGFSQMLTDFSILYAVQDLVIDTGATMRVRAYRGGTEVGTSTSVAPPDLYWPSATLSISVAQGFNSVVVDWYLAPPGGGDYGPIFMADNMLVTAAAAAVPEPSSLIEVVAGGGALIAVLRIRRQSRLRAKTRRGGSSLGSEK